MGDDIRGRPYLNERMGFSTGYPMIGWLAALDPAATTDVSDDALERDWEIEREALLRREAFYVIRGSEDERLATDQPPRLGNKGA